MGKTTLAYAAVGVSLFYLFLFQSIYVGAADINTLPQIVRWEDGNGIDENGDEIADTWAFDTVNPAGKYVLFGTAGEVLKKQEHFDDTESLDDGYTSTEQNPGRFAFRCNVFSGFSGTVDITMQEKSGRQISFSLYEKNFFEGNLFGATGLYSIVNAQAVWNDCIYRVDYPEQYFDMAEGKFVLIQMEVTQELLEQIIETEADTLTEITEDTQPRASDSETEEAGEVENIENMEQTDLAGQAESEVRTDLTKGLTKRFLVFGSAISAGLLSMLLLLRKRKKRS